MIITGLLYELQVVGGIIRYEKTKQQAAGSNPSEGTA